ncbi:hypothetical protein A5780_19235 [Nocardia sp. 852002-20019_SCH5090214]|uniref:VG15 protein n=1 Tax=Nocardia sp. 852002-20019_SCH5090214 TaxID=1834087 RepID=UPI0007EB4006|nr:hypothetical protein [Nocardia sp. 852002-20019_SCH5090214]OBA62194.1 hypothetical protein A5780_19235 [Nocardia sp. 852002-20019_SCH5090214]
MTVSPAERQYILAQVNDLAAADLDALWQQASELPTGEFADYVTQAFPELADPYAAMAAELAATWYADSLSITDYVPVPGPLPIREQLIKSALWALGGNGTVALDRLKGTMQRSVFDGARQTILDNVNQEGARWARYASPNACAFCGLMASRGAVYTSEAAALKVVGRGKEMTLQERRIRAAGGTRFQGRNIAGGIKARGTQKLGDKYHDRCHCIAVEVRPGSEYQPPPHVQKWDEAYVAATRETRGKGEHGAIDVNAVLAHMRASLGTH